jgi:hypothetical protein
MAFGHRIPTDGRVPHVWLCPTSGRRSGKTMTCLREPVELTRDKGPLGSIVGPRECCLVREDGFRVTAESHQKVRSDCVEQVIAVERQRIDKRECRARALDLGDRDRAVERGDRARIWPQSVEAALGASL